MPKITISTEYIKLDQLLKFADITSSGGESRILIADGAVSVDGEPCLMRGKKIRPGMTVTVDSPEYSIKTQITVSSESSSS